MENLGNPTTFAHNAALSLTEADGLKSEAVAKWGSTVTNSLVLVSNGRFAEAGIYAGIGVATNVFGAKYRHKLEEVAATKQDDELETKSSKTKELGVKMSGRLFQAGSNYATNILAGATGLSGQQLELAMHLLTFTTLNEAEQVSQSPEATERGEHIHTLREIISWAGEKAMELNTEDQYARFCKDKVTELTKERPKTITLPDQDPLIKKPQRTVKHYPREVSKTRHTSEGEQVETVRYPILNRALREKAGEGQELPKRAVLFADITGGYPGEKLLLRNATILATTGKVTELGGGVSTPVLEMLAERRKNSQGTTYIRDEERDINVHLDADRSEITYYNCEDKKSYEFFKGEDQNEVFSNLEQSGLFDDAELLSLRQIAKTNGAVVGMSRATSRKLAVAEGTSEDSVAVILNYPFNDLSEDDEIRVAKYLEKVAKDKVVIVRADQARSAYRKYLAREGTLDSYSISNGLLQQSKPLPEEIVRELDDLGYEWDAKKTRDLVEELANGYAKIEMVNNEPLRTVKVMRANVYTTDPETGKRYKLVQDHKIAPTAAGAPEIRSRQGEPYSLYRSLRENNPEYTLSLRLSKMGVDMAQVTQQPFTHVVEERASNTYPGMNAKYDNYDTSVEIPYSFKTNNKIIAAQHDSGGFTYFNWEEVHSED